MPSAIAQTPETCYHMAHDRNIRVLNLRPLVEYIWNATVPECGFGFGRGFDDESSKCDILLQVGSEGSL